MGGAKIGSRSFSSLLLFHSRTPSAGIQRISSFTTTIEFANDYLLIRSSVCFARTLWNWRDYSLASHRLTDRLIEHFASSASSTNNSSVIQICNRYFTASVALLSSEDDETKQTATDTPYKEDGIVLVWYDHEDAPDLAHALNSVHDQVEAAGEVTYCVFAWGYRRPVSSRSDQKTPKEIEQEYSRRVLWCLDRGYEYIPSCDLSDEGVKRGHGERDKEGFARLVEAIQGTVWSSAVMATTTKKSLKSSYEETISAVVETSDENNGNNSDGDDLTNQYVPPDPSMMQAYKEDKEREKKAQEALLKEIDEAGNQTTNATVDGVNDEVANVGDQANERLLNQFEGAIQEASRIRDMSRSGELSDEERRQRAGDAALMLVNLLDQMGYDDDEDDEAGGASSDGDEGKEEKVA